MHSIFLVLGKSVLGRLGIGLLFGGMIGFEREFHGRPAGFRTHILVCLGAVLLTVSTELIIIPYARETYSIVVGRVVAGVITGVGFLGAGVIVRMGDSVRGLTTAASIWFTAALGVVIGEGSILLALYGTLLILIVLTLFNKLDVLIPPMSHRKILVVCNSECALASKEALLPVFRKFKIHVYDIFAEYNKNDQMIHLEYYIHVRNHLQSLDFVEKIKNIEGINCVRWGTSNE